MWHFNSLHRKHFIHQTGNMMSHTLPATALVVIPQLTGYSSFAAARRTETEPLCRQMVAIWGRDKSSMLRLPPHHLEWLHKPHISASKLCKCGDATVQHCSLESIQHPSPTSPELYFRVSAVMNIYVFYLRIAPHPLLTKHQVTWSRGSDNTDTLHWLLSLTGHRQHLGATLIGKLHHPQRTRNQLDTGWPVRASDREADYCLPHNTFHTTEPGDGFSALRHERWGRSTNNIITRECKTQLITDCRLSHEKRRHMQHSEINPESRNLPKLEYPGQWSQGCCGSSLGGFLCPSSGGIKWDHNSRETTKIRNFFLLSVDEEERIGTIRGFCMDYTSLAFDK